MAASCWVRSFLTNGYGVFDALRDALPRRYPISVLLPVGGEGMTGRCWPIAACQETRVGLEASNGCSRPKGDIEHFFSKAVIDLPVIGRVSVCWKV